MNKRSLERELLHMLDEDVRFVDVTTSVTPEATVRAEIIAKEEGFLSGVEELIMLFNLYDIRILKSLKDGDKIKPQTRVFLLRGSSKDILVCERTALNILSKMSGITTLTQKYINRAQKADKRIKIAATRKTTPLFRYFEKKAVKIAGGDTHRMGLGDMVLIKDNHLKLFGSPKKALTEAKKATSFTRKIEIEVSSKKDAIEAAESGADIIMLDNLKPAEIKEIVLDLEKRKLRDNAIIEASGNINLDNVSDYAKTGVDFLSVGNLTRSAPSLDFTLTILP